MDSGEDTHVVFIRVCDTCDNVVVQQNQAIAINMSDSLQWLFLSLDIERRSLVAAKLKPNVPRHRGGPDQTAYAA